MTSHHHQLPGFFSKLISESPCMFVCIFQKYKYTTYFLVSHVPKKNHKHLSFQPSHVIYLTNTQWLLLLPKRVLSPTNPREFFWCYTITN
jgi:hypothetical protein